MFSLSEQQTYELWQKCIAIKDISDPVVFAQIEELVQQVITTKQLTDDEVNQLHELSNCAVIVNYSEQKNEDVAENEWGEQFKIDTSGDSEEIKLNNRRNHLLLCNKANLPVIEGMRRCVKQIATPAKYTLVQENGKN